MIDGCFINTHERCNGKQIDTLHERFLFGFIASLKMLG